MGLFKSDFLNSSDEVLSVGEFSRRLKMLFKTRVPELWLRGEVSGVRPSANGHIYFTLKDADASISAVLFRGYAASPSLKLREGMKILAYGEISLYEVRGSYQIVVKAMMPDGEGDLARRFQELKQKLSQEGLFDASNKISIPKFAKKIAVVTSPTGAAVRDFIRILERRQWRGEVYILPSKVQGVGAAEEIATQIKFADEFRFADGDGFDVIVVGRGGGSLEDLFAFNEEIVARAVAAAETPIISAVGHEIDFSLSDFAADLRAETPSAAAELISSSCLDCISRFENASQTLSDIIRSRFDELQKKLNSLSEILRLNSPSDKIHTENLRLDEMSARLQSLFEGRFSSLKLKLGSLENRLMQRNPKSKLELLKQRLNSYEKQIELLGIDKTLKRGFALVLNSDNKIVPTASLLNSGERVHIKFSDADKDAQILS